MTVPRVAVVGMGGFASDHRSWARELDAKGAIRQVAQVAPAFDHRTFAADIAALSERGVAVYDSLRQMLAAQRREIDLVTIPTGIHLHRPMTVACLEAGCHVLVEKPASGSIQDTDAMIRAEEQSGPQVTVGYQHLYREDVALLKEWICGGRFGAVRRVKAFGSWPRSLEYYGRNEWAGLYGLGDRWVLDAPHQNAMAHAVNLMCYLGCERPRQSLAPESIRAELYRCNAIRSADSVSLRMRSAEGTEVFFAASHCTEEQLATVFVLEAEKATVTLEYEGGGVIEWSAGGREPLPVPEAGVTDVMEKAAALATGGLDLPPCPLAVARAQTLCTCGSYESSAVHELSGGELREGTVVFPGMKEAVLRAFAEAALFSELSLPWARAGDEVDLRGYGYYPAFRPPP